MGLVYAILLTILLVFSLALTILSLPGNWLMVVAVGVYVWLVPSGSWADLPLWVLLVTLALALLGELFEFLAGMLGVARVKGSPRSAGFALVGTVLGSVVGLVLSLMIPIPLLAQVVMAVLFSALGAMIGAILGEWKKGVKFARLSEVGQAAFWGRVLGTLSKVVAGAMMIALIVFVFLFQAIGALWQ